MLINAIRWLDKDLAQPVPRSPYSLDEFGRQEYADPVVPVQILLVMMGFTIALFINQPTNNVSTWIWYTSLTCGVIYFLLFMFYLTEYYEKLWQPYYLLPTDKMFFRFYSLLIGVFVIVLMGQYPIFWPIYVLVLFFVMLYKKQKTRETFQSAFDNEFGHYSQCNDRKYKCQYVLVETFTINFFFLGIVILLPFAALNFFTGMIVGYPNSLVSEFEGRFIGVEKGIYEIIFVSNLIIITFITALFWLKKINTGLREMQNQIEEGHCEYFETRDLRVRMGLTPDYKKSTLV